jgi:hypothetical protein
MQKVASAWQPVLVEGNHMGHRPFSKIGRCVREEIVSESFSPEQQQQVKGGNAGTGESPHPIFGPLENTSIYRLTKVPMRFNNVLVQAF